MEAQGQTQEAPKEQTLEETLAAVEGIIDRMQQRDITLEDSFSLYQQGIGMLKQCNEKIDAVEKKMLLLNEAGEAEGHML